MYLYVYDWMYVCVCVSWGSLPRLVSASCVSVSVYVCARVCTVYVCVVLRSFLLCAQGLDASIVQRFPEFTFRCDVEAVSGWALEPADILPQAERLTALRNTLISLQVRATLNTHYQP